MHPYENRGLLPFCCVNNIGYICGIWWRVTDYRFAAGPRVMMLNRQEKSDQDKNNQDVVFLSEEKVVDESVYVLGDDSLTLKQSQPGNFADPRNLGVIRTGAFQGSAAVALTSAPLTSTLPQNSAVVPNAAASVPTSELQKRLLKFAELVANITEAYTASIFLANDDCSALSVQGVHTLSRDFLYNAQINIGSGLIGWAAQHGKKVSAAPFEHNATTLCCYSADQGLKSFIAIPVLGNKSQVLGVIACDSKKSYAFAKVTEKFLEQCAEHVAGLVQVHRALSEANLHQPINQNDLNSFIEDLQKCSDEYSLLSHAANLPEDLIERDALVVMTTQEGAGREGMFYTSGDANRKDHRMLDMVCRHKKVICAERSVHALPTDDARQRSFLSIPFHIMGKEVGSFNLLSCPFRAFDAVQIGALEKVAHIIGRELERLRLREQLASISEANAMLPWKQFSIQSKLLLDEARRKKQSLSLIRVALTNMTEIEFVGGAEVANVMLQKVMRLVDQVKHHYALACFLYGHQILILTQTQEAERTMLRLERLIERISGQDFPTIKFPVGLKLGEIISQGMHIVTAQSPKDGDSLPELTAKSLRVLELSLQSPKSGTGKFELPAGVTRVRNRA